MSTADEVSRRRERCDLIVAGRWYEYNYDLAFHVAVDRVVMAWEQADRLAVTSRDRMAEEGLRRAETGRRPVQDRIQRAWGPRS